MRNSALEVVDEIIMNCRFGIRKNSELKGVLPVMYIVSIRAGSQTR